MTTFRQYPYFCTAYSFKIEFIQSLLGTIFCHLEILKKNQHRKYYSFSAIGYFLQILFSLPLGAF